LKAVDLALLAGLVGPESLHDAEGRFVHMNAAAERARGHSGPELLGHHFTEMLAPEEREKVAAQFRRAAEWGEPTEFETLFVDAGGQLRGTRAQHLPLRSGAEIVGVLILAFDARRPPSEPNGLDAQPQLTDRQREILDLIAAGQSTSEIAKNLTLSTETVRNHLRGVFRELHAHTRLEAIATARRHGLLAPPVLGPPSPDPGVRAE